MSKSAPTKFTGHGYALLDALHRAEEAHRNAPAEPGQFGSDERFSLAEIMALAHASMVHWKEYEDLIALGLVERAGRLAYPRNGEEDDAYRITDRGRREFARGHPGWNGREVESA